MNPARRKLFHVLEKTKQQQSVLDVTVKEAAKPVEQAVVVPATVVVPIKLEEVTVEVEIPAEIPVVESVETETESAEETEIKKNMPPRTKKYKKDVEIGE